MADIFGYSRNPSPKKVFSSSGATLKFGGEGNAGNKVGNLIQNWNVNYNNNITEIFELGSDAIYWVKGRPTGAGNISRIIGLGNFKLFPDNAFDICDGGVTMEIEATPGQCPNQDIGGVSLSMGGCIVTQIGFSANVADTRINENISWRFSTLNVEEV
jgi:hypothetical protein